MRVLRAWCYRLLGIGPSAMRDDELDAELEQHVQLHVDDLMRSGASASEARRQAMLTIGGMERTREAVRDQRGFPLLAQFGQDIRQGLRMFRRQPTFSLAAVLTLALGIGANTALFSLLDGLILRPLPVSHPDGLVRLTTRGEETLGYVMFDRLRQQSTSFSSVIAVQPPVRRSSIEDALGQDDVLVHAVSGEYFDGLGIHAMRGRVFGPSEAGWEADSVAVISEGRWRARYGGVPSAIGSHLRYQNRSHTIIGIAPRGFTGLIAENPADVWVPLKQTMPPDSMIWTRARFLKVMGRLRGGVTREGALAEASTIVGATYGLGVEPGANGYSSLREHFTKPLLVLQTLVALVLLVACANLANLLLARGAARTREVAIRQAVGASRARLIRQLVTESLVLSGVGGAIAIGVAALLTGTLLKFLPPEYAGATGQLSLRLELPLLLFALGLTLVTGMACSLPPAFRATQRASGTRLQTRESAGDGRSIAGRALMIGSIAMCTVLVAGAGLFMRTLRNLWTLDSGFAAQQVLVADLDVRRGPGLPPALSTYETLLGRVRQLSGVDAAGFSRIGQLEGGFIEFNISLPGEQLSVKDRADRPNAIEQRVSPGFLRAMGTPILAGRDVSDTDTAEAPQVALVNEDFVRLYLNRPDPATVVGRHFLTDAGEFQIVGLVKDTKWVDLREQNRPMFYRPVRQASPPAATLAIRSTRPLEQVADELKREAAAEGVRLRNVVPFTEMVNRTLVTERMLAYLSASIGALAVLIVGVGLYGVMAYTVSRRISEIGIRRALGATGAAVQWLIVRDSLLLLSLGIPLGIGVTMVAAPLLASLLFGLAPTDAATLGWTVAGLTVVTLLAAMGPALRASRVDPLRALRAE